MTSSKEGKADRISMYSDSPLPTSKSKSHCNLDHITRSFNCSIANIRIEILCPKGASQEEAAAAKDGDQAAVSNAFKSDSSWSTVSDSDEPKLGPEVYKIYEKTTLYIRQLFKDPNNKKLREKLICLNKSITKYKPSFQIDINVLKFLANQYYTLKGSSYQARLQMPQETAIHDIIC